jgi:cell wall-associated NlpC family hydrolase
MTGPAAAVAGWRQAVNAAWQSLAAPGPADRQGRVQQVIDRARSQIGVPYSWGGGNRNGPTLGVQDGGVADTYQDYAHKGFDCSGLMQYAFTGAGVNLDRPASTEATEGEHVPWTQREPGDMIFYAYDNGAGEIHHVALYTGKNAQGQDMMVEAEESGTTVHEVPVRATNELVKSVTRPIR